MLTLKDGMDIEYVAVCDPETFHDLEEIGRSALLAVAAKVGKTRGLSTTLF